MIIVFYIQARDGIPSLYALYCNRIECVFLKQGGCAMIRFERSRQYRHHKKAEAVKYAKKAAALAGEIDGSAQFQVFTGVFGSVERIFWVVDFEGLAALEKSLLKIEADDRWKEFIENAREDIFVDGTGRDAIMEPVS